MTNMKEIHEDNFLRDITQRNLATFSHKDYEKHDKWLRDDCSIARIYECQHMCTACRYGIYNVHTELTTCLRHALSYTFLEKVLV